MSTLVAIEDLVHAGILSSIGALSSDQLVVLDVALRDAEAITENHIGYSLLSATTTERVQWYRIDYDKDTYQHVWRATVGRHPVTSVTTANVSIANAYAVKTLNRDVPDTDLEYIAGYADTDGQPSEAPALPRAIKRVIMNMAGFMLLSTGDGSLFQRKIVQLPGGQSTIQLTRDNFIQHQLRSLSHRHGVIAI